MSKPDRTFEFEHERKILGTYYLKTNQDGPGESVCDCGYTVSSDARDMGSAREMSAHSQGVAVAMVFNAMQLNFVASITDVAVALCNKLSFDIIESVPPAFNHPTLRLVDAFIM